MLKISAEGRNGKHEDLRSPSWNNQTPHGAID
jgi:hypothetical protein